MPFRPFDMGRYVMFGLHDTLRRLAAGLAIAAVTLAAGWLSSPPAPASADHLCGGTGSSAGPFDILTYEAASWRTTYSKAMELASKNRLFPDDARFRTPQMETGARSAGSSSLVNPDIPPTILKAIAWIESSWAQAAQSVPYGSVGPVLVSHDCGYGLTQVTSGMQNTKGRPDLYQAMIGGHFGVNIAEGAKILVSKWNAAPDYRPIVGSRQPTITEDWYYALWSYNGFTFKNHPLNPAYSAQRGAYRCDGTQSYASFPYQELVLGCLARPPVVAGTKLWSPTPVTLPNLSQPAFSLSNWTACSSDRRCQGMDMPTPNPAHTDATPVTGTREAAVGAPVLSVGPAHVNVVMAVGETSAPTRVTISNTGTGPLTWRLSPSKTWLRLSRIQGVALGSDIGSRPSTVDLSVDATGLQPGSYYGEVILQSRYAQGLPQKVAVHLNVGWNLSQSRMLPADFNGDGKQDVVGVYDHGDGLISMWAFRSDGTDFSLPTRAYNGCRKCWDLSRSQMVPADVNGDGRDEVIGVYDYGGSIRMWKFASDGNTFAAPTLTYRSCDGCWSLSQSRMLAADVNGDGKDDMLSAYDYGNGTMGIWAFLSNGTGFFPPQLWHRSCTRCWELGQSELLPADVNGDGKDDLVIVYDYGDGYIRMWNFLSNGGGFSPMRQSYRGCTNCWYMDRSQMTVAEVNGDGKSDIVAAYDYGGGVMGMWGYLSDGAAFTSPERLYRSCERCWELSRSRLLPVDVNGDGKGDIVVAYDYGGGVMGMWNFVPGSPLSVHRSY